MMFLETWKGKLVALFCLLVFVFTIVTTARQCSESTQKAGSEIAVSTITTIKQNNEIAAYQSTIEALEKRVDSLENYINTNQELRNENRLNTPNKSNQQHYSDLSKRYADKKPIR